MGVMSQMFMSEGLPGNNMEPTSSDKSVVLNTDYTRDVMSQSAMHNASHVPSQADIWKRDRI